MRRLDRPVQIVAILKTIDAGDKAEISAELEAYIADLEAKQPDRPARLAAILKTIGAQYPDDIRTTLETYISDLEAR